MTKIIVVAVIVCLGLCTGREARATLGGDLASVAANQAQLGATRKIRKLEWGERHELELPSRARIHEYLSPAGTVYAIAWSGPRMPDLRELLGSYFAELGHRGARRGGHHALRVAGQDVVVQSSGHRHRFSGRAWLPSLVPVGFDLDFAVEK